MICRPAGRLTFKPDELKAGQIKPINKGVDDANRIVFANPVLQAFRKQRALAAILALNKALHLIPASQRGNLNARITPRAAFSHSQDPNRTCSISATASPRWASEHASLLITNLNRPTLCIRSDRSPSHCGIRRRHQGCLMWQALVITHRYLGVAAGALMVMWFLSGIVMMYVGFPRVTETERVRTLEPIAWSMCCRSDVRSIAGEDQVLAASVENLGGSPALTLRRPGRPDTTLDLARQAVVRVDTAQAQSIARDAAPRITRWPATPEFTGQIQTDQWTVGRLVRDRPLFRFALDDPARTILYVSGTSGRVVHWTTATQRFWNWLGAIPHWLYFADLRSDVVMWSEIVIWTSLFGTFLTAIGLYIGISQLKLRSKGKFSPYRCWFYWHHMIGLVFGIVTLTWVVSGLISMNPWGFLESRGSAGAQG